MEWDGVFDFALAPPLASGVLLGPLLLVLLGAPAQILIFSYFRIGPLLISILLALLLFLILVARKALFKFFRPKTSEVFVPLFGYHFQPPDVPE